VLTLDGLRDLPADLTGCDLLAASGFARDRATAKANARACLNARVRLAGAVRVLCEVADAAVDLGHGRWRVDMRCWVAPRLRVRVARDGAP
jgi:hypothetical protein